MNMDMKSIMKQAETLQAEMAKKQEELGRMTFEASAGGGMVTAMVNGRHELVKLAIDPTVMSAGDVEMLQDLVIAAVNEGFKRANEAMQQSLSGMMGGLGSLKGMF
ncbi:MAG: YbaB/EbfC family nucleoid-associated protein [bacterium]